MISKFSIKRKVVFVICDENFTGVEKYYDGTKFVDNDEYYNVNKELSCIWDWSDHKFIDVETYAKTKQNTYGIIYPLVAALNEYGIFFVPVTKEDLGGNHVGYTQLDKIQALLIGNSANDDEGELKRIISYLKDYRSEANIEETPNFIGFVYSGGISDAQDNSLETQYSIKVKQFVLNLRQYIQDIGKLSYINPNLFKFVDCNVNITARASLYNDGTKTEYWPDFNNKHKLLKVQEDLKSTFSYYELIQNPGGTLHELPSGTSFIGESGSFSGYVTNRGVEIGASNKPGFVLSVSDLNNISSLVSFKIIEFLGYDTFFERLPVEYYRFNNTIDRMFLYNAEEIIELEDLKGINPEETYDADSDLGKLGTLLKELTFESDRTFVCVIDKEIYSKFTHLILFTKDNKYIGWVKFHSRQEIPVGAKIRISIQFVKTTTDYSVVADFDVEQVSYFSHVNGSISEDESAQIINRTFYIVDRKEDDDMFITSMLSSAAVNDTSIGDGKAQVNINEVYDKSDRSDRITNDIKKSGDSLFIRNGILRDRDNSTYNPYIKFDITPSILSSIYSEKTDTTLTGNLSSYIKNTLKIGFDPKRGLYLWTILPLKDDTLKVVTIFCSCYKTQILEHVLKINANTISSLIKLNKEMVQKIKIAFANNDLIVNFNGKVLKAQEESNTSYEKTVNNVKYTISEVSTYCDYLYKDKGYIIFPAWYDLWNLAYSVIDKSVFVIDCSGELHKLSDYKNFPEYAYVENFPGPKNTDYKNIVANYLAGGMILLELVLQGIPVDRISIYDSAFVVDKNFYKIDIYPTSYKFTKKISLKKKVDNSRSVFIPNNNFPILDFYVSNNAVGIKSPSTLDESGTVWREFYFDESEKKATVKRTVNNNINTKYICARGVFLSVVNESIGLT